MLILNPLEKLHKNSREISYQRKSYGKMEFFTFTVLLSAKKGQIVVPYCLKLLTRC